MRPKDLEDNFRDYLSSLRNSQGEPYGPKYISDKISRFRKLCDQVSIARLRNITDATYFDVVETVIDRFDDDSNKSPAGSQYKDYLVIVRLLYEMQNSGKSAPRYRHYGGVRIR